MKIPTILLSILPISIIIGSSFSLVNMLLFSLCFIFIYFSKNNIKIEDTKSVLLLLTLYLYLVFNSLISLDISSGIYRNLGFIRFILFFLIQRAPRDARAPSRRVRRKRLKQGSLENFFQTYCLHFHRNVEQL